LGAVAGGLPLPRIARAATTSTVVCVKGAGSMPATATAPNLDVIVKMLDHGLMSFTGKTSVAEAWKEFVSPKDIIGLKINCLGRRMLPTHPIFTDAVIKSLVSAGMDENNIIVWDRFGDQMEDGGYVLKSGTGVKFLASEKADEPVGYDEKFAYEGKDDDESKRDKTAGNKSYVAKLLTEKITAMISLPVLKDHVLAGVTLALKNLAFGVTNNNGRLHINNCDPFIAEACAMPEVKGKLRLNILDAVEACYDGGPCPRNPSQKWRPEMLYVATDMVALDTIAAQVIDAKRMEKGRPPAMLKARHIATAAGLKLGTNVKDEIKVENLTV
jgi:uncharacterized protein (DUF362 family)